MQKNGILFTSDNCPDLTKISINGKLKSLGVESIDVEKTIDLSEKIEFDVSLNDGIEFFSKVECFKDGDYYKLRFYPSEKLEQVVSIPYWMTRKGMNNCPFYAFYKGKKVTSSSASTGSFNFLPSVSSGARTSLELGISGYSFSEEENPLYKGITVGKK